MQCGARALATASGDERERLLKMREALLELAVTEDWLSGKTRDRTAFIQQADRIARVCALSRTG
jgi:hypothetical protein